jgi:predicted nucleic acid-binding Zn ribbon protein
MALFRASVSVVRDARGCCLKAITNFAGMCARRRRRPTELGARTGRSALRKRKFGAPHGSADNLLAFVKIAEQAFGRKAPASAPSSARAIARPTALDELQGEICPVCAKGFDAPSISQKFCSEACRRAAEYERWHGWRAEARKGMACEDCGGAIVDAGKSNRQACGECQRERGREAVCRYRRRLKAESRPSWRAEARKSMTCITCGGAIVGAVRSDQKRCDECRREHKRAMTRRWRLKAGG